MTAKIKPVVPASYFAARRSRASSETLEALAKDAMASMAPALGAANGRATMFTLSTREALEVAVWAEDRLADLQVPLGARAGTVVHATSAGPSAASYKYAAIGTKISFRRDTKGSWTLTAADQIKVYPKSTGKRWLVVTPVAREAIIENAMKGILVHEDEKEAA
jgi:hypothetical protein